jgi:hypothetical protein
MAEPPQSTVQPTPTASGETVEFVWRVNSQDPRAVRDATRWIKWAGTVVQLFPVTITWREDCEELEEHITACDIPNRRTLTLMTDENCVVRKQRSQRTARENSKWQSLKRKLEQKKNVKCDSSRACEALVSSAKDRSQKRVGMIIRGEYFLACPSVAGRYACSRPQRGAQHVPHGWSASSACGCRRC